MHQARKFRREAEIIYRFQRTDESRRLRNKAANSLKQAVKRAVLDYEHGVASSTDPKRFWKYVRTKQKSHPRIGPLYVSESGSLTDDPKECAQLFAEEYASYFCGSDKSAPIPVLQTQATLTSISFSPTLL